MIDSKTFDTVSQAAHVFFAAFVVLAFAHYGLAILGGMLMFIFAALKEFWYDYHFESVAVRGSSARDFAFYLVGIALAGLVLL